MSDRKNSARQRLIQAAIRLFLKQGVTNTTTRQIAELAQVNEVTLFRNFGNKQGLLLAVIEDPEIFKWLGTTLAAQSQTESDPATALRHYAEAYLKALAEIPDLVRSLIGEAGHSINLRQALGRGLTQANRYTAQYLAIILPGATPPETIASLINPLLLGYAILDFTSDFWGDSTPDESREAFLTHLVKLFLPGSVGATSAATPAAIIDLSPDAVHAILRRSRKAGLQNYALAYVLFAGGLSVEETIRLRQSHLIRSEPHLLQVAGRQVPLNQWILGQRYASRSRNPLTQWLKSRKDDQAAMFISEAGEPMTAIDLRLGWQRWIADQTLPDGEAGTMGKAQSKTIEQAQQTWCVEMLTRGVSVADLSILSGKPLMELQPYLRRAREKLALDEAVRLDQKPGRGD